MAKELNPNKPIETRCNYPVKIYEVFYKRYYNGSYYDRDTDIWWPRQWNWDGSDEQNERSLDLVNVNG